MGSRSRHTQSQGMGVGSKRLLRLIHYGREPVHLIAEERTFRPAGCHQLQH